MADEPTRQHYKLATGKGTNKDPGGPRTPAKKGGAVKDTKKGKTPC
jgi:hypothetical protein